MDMVGRVEPVEARELGVVKSSILCQFRFWLEASKKGQLYFSDGYYWHPIEERHLHRTFKYLSLDELKRVIGELVDSGLIIEGNYQIESYELDNWYSMPEFSTFRDMPITEVSQ